MTSLQIDIVIVLTRIYMRYKYIDQGIECDWEALDQLKKLGFFNAYQSCHGNPDTVWRYHGGATSLHAKFDDETEKYK